MAGGTESVCVCVWWGSSPLAPPPQRGAGAEEQSWRASMQSPAILSRAEFSWGRPGASRGLHFPFQLLCHSHKDLQSKRIMGNAGVKLINLIPFILAYKLAICLHLDNIINAAYCWKLKCVVTIIHQFWICWIPILQPAYLYRYSSLSSSEAGRLGDLQRKKSYSLVLSESQVLLKSSYFFFTNVIF